MTIFMTFLVGFGGTVVFFFNVAVLTMVVLAVYRSATYNAYQVTLCSATNDKKYQIMFIQSNDVWSVVKDAQAEGKDKSQKEGEAWCVKDITRI